MMTVLCNISCFWSRSRQEYWVKGMTSGHIQEVAEVRYDCDADTILVKVRQHGAACHTGCRSCFFNLVGPDGNVSEDGCKPEDVA